MALAVIELCGKAVEVVPDGPHDFDSNGKIPCWDCDLSKECDSHQMFCRDYMYHVHFKLATNECK